MVESSIFSYKIVALLFGTELIKVLRYTLRMMGIPLDSLPTTVWVDNESVANKSPTA